jgi:hypothetical protein
MYERPVAQSHIRGDRKPGTSAARVASHLQEIGGRAETAMGLLFYFALFVLMCIFGWSVRGTTDQ